MGSIIQRHRPRVAHAEVPHQTLEVAQSDRVGVTLEPVHEQHVPAESTKAEQVLKELPRVSGLVGLLGDRAGDRQSPLRAHQGARKWKIMQSSSLQSGSARSSRYADRPG